ncbi:hypothetical protein GCM10010302_10990 [Streptomyces polychromogenes]|uniref:Uncharacterized protein n=2 Tax=Streptomyces TaxID=1883 RepID=A0ABP3ERE7_9ACTN
MAHMIIEAGDEAMPDNTGPSRAIMIGGGPAALARPTGALLVDDCGSLFHRGVLDSLGHTPDQLRALDRCGFDPYLHAAPTERVPSTAVREWLDQLATSGPVINGTAELAVDVEGRLVAIIEPAGDKAPLTLDVEGIPTLAPGLPGQLVPGTDPALHSFNQVGHELLKTLHRTGPAANELVGALIDLVNERGGGPADVLALLEGADPLLLAPVTAPVQAIRAIAAFSRARADAAGRLCFGDSLVYGRYAATAADSWIVAGGGDHALAAAEALLTGNPAAEVTVVAAAIDTAAANTARYRDLRSRHTADGGGDGRLRFRTGTEPGPITLTGTGRFTEGGVEADGYAMAIGRRRELPHAVGKLTYWARWAQGRITGTLLFDTDLHYLGYRLHFAGEGLVHQVDVTGAASWFLPAEVFPAEQARRVERMGQRATPPESGLTPTDVLPVAEQGARLAAARRRGTVREADTVPERWVPSA